MSADSYDFVDEAAFVEEDTNDVEPAGRAPEQDGPPVSTVIPGVPEPEFPDMFAFMNEFICKQFSRKISAQSESGLRWDKNWWRYPEVVLRAEAMWRSYEASRVESIENPGALEAWLRVVADHHMSVVLNGAHGPMCYTSGPQPTLGGTYPPGYGTESKEGNNDATN